MVENILSTFLTSLLQEMVSVAVQNVQDMENIVKDPIKNGTNGSSHNNGYDPYKHFVSFFLFHTKILLVLCRIYDLLYSHAFPSSPSSLNLRCLCLSLLCCPVSTWPPIHPPTVNHLSLCPKLPVFCPLYQSSSSLPLTFLLDHSVTLPPSLPFPPLSVDCTVVNSEITIPVNRILCVAALHRSSLAWPQTNVMSFTK